MADQLSVRFAQLRSEIEESAVLPLAADVRERGSRRRFAGLFGTVAALLAGGVAVLAAAMLVTAPTGGPFGPSASGSWSRPGPSEWAFPSVHRPSPHGGPPRGIRTTLPPGLVMLEEGQPGWQRSDDRNRESAFNPCGGTDPTRAGRTDARTLVGPGHASRPGEDRGAEAVVTHQIFLFTDQAAATRAYDGLRSGAGRCGWTVSPAEEDDDGRRDSGSRSDPPDPQQYWQHEFELVRERNAVFVIHAKIKGDGYQYWATTGWQAIFWAVGPLCQAGVICLPDPPK